MRGRCFIAVACAWLLWSAGPLGHTLRELLLRLPVLEGPVPTFYADGTRDQAVRVQQLITGATEYYSRTTGVALPVEVGLVGETEWHSFPAKGPSPYSHFIPSVLSLSQHIISLPTGRGHALDLLLNQLIRDSQDVRGLGLPAEELSRRFTPLAALHEIGQFYVRNARPSTPAWLIEFGSSYLASAFLAEQHPDDAGIWVAVMLASAKHVTPTPHVSGDWHAGGRAKNYLVYLGRLQARINDVQQRHGPDFLKNIRGQTDAAAVLRLIEHASPGFREWVGRHHGER